MITLQVNGREMTFSDKELTSILEEHFSSKTQHNEAMEVAQKPTEGKVFEVRPQAIDQTLFKKKRKDSRQEATRQHIVEAFEEMKKNPKKYAKDFKTLMPVKTRIRMTVSEMKQLSIKLGGHTADWVEQALEWAQRISNGETWEEVCNNPDTANWYRLVIWKNGYARLIGGSRNIYNNGPASAVHYYYYYDCDTLMYTVPLVVL